MAGKKKYTGKSLQTEIDKYFARISYHRACQVLVDSGRVNRAGRPVMVYVDAVNDEGEPIEEVVYAVPPNITDLCLSLGITRQTLLNYQNGNDKKASSAVEKAKMLIEAYLHREADTRRKGLAGIKFDLECNHGWRAAPPDDNGGVEIKIDGWDEAWGS